MPNNRKILLTLFVVLTSFCLECRTEKEDGKDDKDSGETDEPVETHLWSRLSKDHSMRHKRWIDFNDVNDVNDVNNFNDVNDVNDESKWKGRNLLSTSTTEADESRHDDSSKFPPIFEKVTIQNLF